MNGLAHPAASLNRRMFLVLKKPKNVSLRDVNALSSHTQEMQKLYVASISFLYGNVSCGKYNLRTRENHDKKIV
jgi:hypothetical protein